MTKRDWMKTGETVEIKGRITWGKIERLVTEEFEIEEREITLLKVLQFDEKSSSFQQFTVDPMWSTLLKRGAMVAFKLSDYLSKNGKTYLQGTPLDIRNE